jgi:hypothetical protein
MRDGKCVCIVGECSICVCRCVCPPFSRVSSITITICTLSSTCITMADEDGNGEGKIHVNSFISFSMGDVRRPSFVVGAAERASMSFGIRNKCIFEGGICYKQCQCQLTVVYQRLGI